MKRAVYILISLMLINFSSLSSKDKVVGNRPSTGDSLEILSSPDLYNLSVKWANEYNSSFPGAKIKVSIISDTRVAENLIADGNIGFISNEFYSGLWKESVWKAVVGRDIMVPVINSSNPFLEVINMHGISPDDFVRFLTDKKSVNWGTLLKNDQKTPAGYYWINDNSMIKNLSGFLKTNQTTFVGNEVKNGKEMISAIQNDQYSIGFCRITDILDVNNQSIVENIRLLPIDRNGNGLIDYNEKIYDDFNDFSRGVWIGKYPKSLFSNIYSVSSNQPGDAAEIAFLKWVLTEGQQFLYGNGYSDLLLSERQATIEKLNNAEIYADATTDNSYLLKAILFIISALIIIALIADGMARYLKRKKSDMHIPISVSESVLSENSLLIPGGLFYGKTHTWAFMEQDGNVKVGVDDFLQHITGPITRIKMKHKGESIKKGEEIVSIIQNGKQLNLYAPVSGIIKEQNKILDTDSSVINSSPYTEGWIYKIEPTNWSRENQLLFMADKYKHYLTNEFSRLKDFLAESLKPDSETYNRVVLQDGGELRSGILSNLGPEVWEDFQTKFIDPSRQIWFYEII